MPSIIPNEAEEDFLLDAWKNKDFYIGLFADTPAAVNALGEAITFADLTPVGNVVPASSGAANGAASGNEWRMDPADIAVPTGANAGDDATHPQIEFTADAGGADDDVAGYYIRTDTNVLRVVNLHPEVSSSGVRKVMAEGAKYRVNPSLGAE